ncbi:protein-L-isoaspartate(D-aspartate) O-methyltransferase [Haloactinospora alba]|uniref:Protein-L-isoaspartate O-methyltransferase n=1 Tax=Haloactinospora alba TaxID=405555 RepID=A0A543N7M6_9ACTN|nr:methyltransferase, FxLD system [Haloactinospora alba]TQN27807.1 protein-L-isoaspartate(D-aspartate) O-methyltransferase [Haloactinospora alba]
MGPAHTVDGDEYAFLLREAMVGELQELGVLGRDRIADAFRSVPRHTFLPEKSLEEAYAADSSVVTKRDENGIAISSISAARMQAVMLRQLQIESGDRVLEIGSGGYNAALISAMAGPEGKVTTVDIDPEVVERARNGLTAAGHPHVDVVLGDADHGVADNAPYDRIIVTAGAWDIPPAWIDQLTEGGRLVVPLRMRGLTRSIAFERDAQRLVSREYALCGFVPMQGAEAHQERLVLLDGDEVGLRIDSDEHRDATSLREALFSTRTEHWSGVEVGGYEPVDDLALWLGTTAPGFCLLAAQQAPIDRGLVPRGARLGIPTATTEDSLAYRASRPATGDNRFELGVYAHGPQAESLAKQYTELIRLWDREQRGGPGAHFELYPAHTPDESLPEEPKRVIDKRHTRLVISWP